MLTLEGQRIDLRDHQASDLEAYHAWLSDPVTTHYLSWRSTSREASLIKLAEAMYENELQPRRKYFFAVVLKDTRQVIGDAGFTIESQNDQGGVAELGYFLLKPYWGQGYATEAVQLLLAYCFSVLHLHKVTATCDAENHASERVMQKCGMTREAARKKHTLLEGEWRDRVEYALLVENWDRASGTAV
jgi:[ribosomal protein S5]-alanine N-acetyltransferase